MALSLKHRHAIVVSAKAESQGLECANRLRDTERVAKTCNGIGAAWMPKWLRWAVTHLHPTLEPTAYIHDLDYDDGGTPGARLDADIRFLCNGFRAACHSFRWFDPRRCLVILDAFRFFILLRIFGAAAFNYRGRKR